MHLSKALPDAVSLYHDDYEWLQIIDYEHVPFHCRKCHAQGHLFQDCPSNMKSMTTPSMDKSDSDGFTKVPNRKKTHKKPSPSVKKPVTSTSLPSTSNSFEILLQPEVHILDNQKQPEAIPKTSAHSAPSSSKKALTSKQLTDTKTPSHSNMQKRTAHGMEVDSTQMQLTIVDDTEAEQETVKHMEEEPESFHIGDLDILGLQ